MASYTDNIFPSDDKSSGFTNPTHAWNINDSSYAYKSLYGAGAQTATYAAKWSPQTIKNQLSKNWEYAKINSVKLITRVRVPAGTGNIKNVKWSFNYNGDFDQSSSPNTQFNTSFNDYPYTLTDSRYNILTNGALAQIDVDNNRAVTQQVQISAFYLQINYTIPEITYTYVNHDGSFIDTRVAEQGTTPAHPANPTRPSTVEYDYTFSGWSLSGTTYTAQYTATKRKYLIRVLINPEEAGQADLASWEHEYGKEVTLIVIPRNGYKFVKWNDNADNELIDWSGKLASKRIITVTGAKDYIAYFEPVYITYDNMFNFQKWKNRGITGLKTNISNISDVGFTMTITDNNDPMTNTTPSIPVTSGQKYVLEFDTNIVSGFQPFIFYCVNENNDSWGQPGGGGTHTDGTPTYNQKRIEFTPTTDWIALRFDIDGDVGYSGHFENFRIYPAGFDYMSTSVNAAERVDASLWSSPTPIRDKYKFISWNDKPDGGGETYTSQSSFPIKDLILYSQWELDKINWVYVGNQLVSEIYVGTKPVQEVYVGTTKIYG